MASAIKVVDISYSYSDIKAVDDLSFQVEKGEIFGLLGPNGAGKTTVIHLIVGLLKKQVGEISVMGFDPESDPRRVHRMIGYVPQETNVYQDLNAVENLQHHAALYCDDLSTIGSDIEKQLRLLNLWDRRKDAVRKYSGGMKRRLALARALLHMPDVIFFDEPTLGVDVQGKHVLWEHIKQQQVLGKTFIVSTNDMMEADILCDRLAILDRGLMVAIDTPDRLKSALERDIVTLHTNLRIENPEEILNQTGAQAFSQPEPDVLRFEIRDAEKKVEQIIKAVAKTHRLESIRIARPSLDDVFLHHTGRALRD
ncbi:MAG: ATP-binding cassette domain-containing protein [Anaerolineales bacterium]|nr:ATP-binding cassette domain-containing protein [Anaerolineales bacterium]